MTPANHTSGFIPEQLQGEKKGIMESREKNFLSLPCISLSLVASVSMWQAGESGTLSSGLLVRATSPRSSPRASIEC